MPPFKKDRSDKPVGETEITSEQQFSGSGTILLIDNEDMILDVGKALLG
jgi:hypothetical protein